MVETLKDRTIFISGGSRGIGLAIAKRAARDGANVTIAAKTAEPHPKLPGTIYTAAKEIEAAGGQALPVICDIREDDQVEAAVAKTIERFGGIDICINNASAVMPTPMLHTPMKRYDLMNDVNTRGTFLVSKMCAPYLKKGTNPHILSLAPPLDMDPKWFGVRTARRLYYCQDGHEYGDVGSGSRAPACGYRRQFSLATNRDRYGGCAQCAWR